MLRANSILVVDDQDDVREMVSYQLQALGYNVRTANNGLEALKVLNSFKPDLILLDITMPEMNGIEFYHRICDKNGMPKYPVIMHTARAQLAQLFLDFNVAGFLTKPVNLDELLNEVDLVLKRQNRQTDIYTGTKSIKKLLIIEDNKDDYLKIHSVFEKSGYEIDNTNNGVNAVLKAINSPPDVVLTKLNLKDISGDILALRLKFLARTSDVITIVYVNSSSYNQSQREVFEKIKEKTGIAKFIQMVHPQELLDSVDGLLL